MPHPVISVVDGAVLSPTEERMSVGMVEGEFVEVKVFELVYGKAQFPRDVVWVDREGVVMLDDEGHGEVVK